MFPWRVAAGAFVYHARCQEAADTVFDLLYATYSIAIVESDEIGTTAPGRPGR